MDLTSSRICPDSVSTLIMRIPLLLFLILPLSPTSAEVHLVLINPLTSNQASQQDPDTPIELICQVTNVAQANESLMYLHCPMMDNSMSCFTDCSPACQYLGSSGSCETTSALKGVLLDCKPHSLDRDHLAITYHLRRSAIQSSGDWHCAHRGQKSRERRIEKWIPPVTTTRPSTMSSTTLSTTLPSTPTTTATTPHIPIITTPRTSLTIYKPRRTTPAPSPASSKEGSSNILADDKVTSVLETTLLTKRELLVLMLILLTVSLIMNLILCVRCVMVKVYIDDILLKGRVNVCMERCLCLGSSPNARLSKSPLGVDMSTLRLHSQMMYQQSQSQMLSPQHQRILLSAGQTPANVPTHPHGMVSLPCSPALIPYLVHQHHPPTPASLQTGNIMAMTQHQYLNTVQPCGISNSSMTELVDMGSPLYQSPGQMRQNVRPPQTSEPPQVNMAYNWNPVYMDMDDAVGASNRPPPSSHHPGYGIHPPSVTHSNTTQQQGLDTMSSNSSSLLHENGQHVITQHQQPGRAANISRQSTVSGNTTAHFSPANGNRNSPHPSQSHRVDEKTGLSGLYNGESDRFSPEFPVPEPFQTQFVATNGY